MKLRITAAYDVIVEDDFDENEWFFNKYDDYLEINLETLTLEEFFEMEDGMKRAIWETIKEFM